MSYLGLWAGGTFPRIALVSPATVQTTFDKASGAFSCRGGRKTTFPSAESYLRRMIIDINLDQKKTQEHEAYLEATRLLRSIPLTSSLLAGRIDNTAYEHTITHFLHSKQGANRGIAKDVKEEIRAASKVDDSFLNNLPKPSVLPPVPLHQDTILNKFSLSLQNLPQHEVGENDYILLMNRLREDPDFLPVPEWHQEFHAQRPWLDMAILLPKDRNSDIFTHKTLLKKTFFEYHRHKAEPNAAKLHRFRWSATAEAPKRIAEETHAATHSEPHRLLCNKIEDLISSAAHKDAELKAMRKIEIKSLNIPRVLAYRDSSIITLLKAKMSKILHNKKHVPDLDETCTCDVISLYSDDEGEEHFNRPAAVEARFSQRKRHGVVNWASAIPPPTSHHTKLYSFDGASCNPLEPIGEADDMTEVDAPLQAASNITWPLASCSLLFPVNGEWRMVLQLGCLPDQEYSEGQFTNMTSAASLSDAEASLSEGSGEAGKKASRRDSDTSLESFTPSMSGGKAV